MTIEKIVTQLLDEVNRPQDDAWLTRANNAVYQAIARLFVKFDFALFRKSTFIPKQEEAFIYDCATKYQRIEGVYKVNDEADTIFTGKPCHIIDTTSRNIDKDSLAHYELLDDDLLKQNLSLYFNKNINYLVDGFLNLNAAKEEATFESIFLPNVFDYVLYDSWVRFCVLLNEDADRISAVKTLRDEAYNDVVIFDNKFSLKGPIVLRG